MSTSLLFCQDALFSDSEAGTPSFSGNASVLDLKTVLYESICPNCLSHSLSHSDDTDPTVYLEHFKVLNQEPTWIVEAIDLVEQFRVFQPLHLHDFSLARDGIADMRHGSKFRNFLTPHIAKAAGKVKPIATSIYKKWPTLDGILTRVFAKSQYEEVSKAVRDECAQDPVVGYILYVVLS